MINYENMFEVNGNAISVEQAVSLMLQAGNIAATLYKSRDSLKVEDKGPYEGITACSPRQLVTEADRRVQAFLEQELATLTPNIPFLGEEGKKNLTRMTGSQWQCDPIDGTRFFVGKSELKTTGQEDLEGQFTIHLALIKDDTPIFGLVYAPAYGELYFNDTSNSAIFVKFNEKDSNENRSLPDLSKDQIFVLDKNGMNRINSSGDKQKVSRQDMESVFSFGTPKSDGSTLKVMGVAAGQEDFNFCKNFGLFEWDTSAAQAVVKALGGNIYKARLDLRTGDEVLAPLTIGHDKAVNYHNNFLPAFSGGVYHTQPQELYQYLVISQKTYTR